MFLIVLETGKCIIKVLAKWSSFWGRFFLALQAVSILLWAHMASVYTWGNSFLMFLTRTVILSDQGPTHVTWCNLNYGSWRGYGEKGALLHCLWECKLIHPLWKTVWRFLKKLGIKPAYDPAIPLLGIYLRKPTL